MRNIRERNVIGKTAIAVPEMPAKEFTEPKEPTEDEILRRLYREIFNAQMFVKEFKFSPEKFGACVGTERELADALGLQDVGEITDELIESLPVFIPFAMPGVGDSRVEAIQDALDKMRAFLKKKEEVAAGERRDGSVYGSFTLGGATITAYLPDHEPDEWTVAIQRPGVDDVVRTLPMDYAPLFGPDASDVTQLNEFVEELIAQYQLEGEESSA